MKVIWYYTDDFIIYNYYIKYITHAFLKLFCKSIRIAYNWKHFNKFWDKIVFFHFQNIYNLGVKSLFFRSGTSDIFLIIILRLCTVRPTHLVHAFVRIGLSFRSLEYSLNTLTTGLLSSSSRLGLL